MLLKLLKLKANEAIRSGAIATSSSGSVTLPEDLQRAGAVDARGLGQLLRDRLQRAERDEEEVRELSQTLTRMHDTFAHVRVEEPRDVECEASG